MPPDNPGQGLSYERFIAKTEAEILILNSKIEGVESKLSLTNLSTEKMKSELDDLKVDVHKISDNVADLAEDLDGLGTNLRSVDQKLDALKDKVSTLSSNSLLEFTNNLDVRKTVTIILVLLSVISSPSLLNSYLESLQPSSEMNAEQLEKSTEKLERILELLESP